jgi:hypothetical protein
VHIEKIFAGSKNFFYLCNPKIKMQPLTEGTDTGNVAQKVKTYGFN